MLLFVSFSCCRSSLTVSLYEKSYPVHSSWKKKIAFMSQLVYWNDFDITILSNNTEFRSHQALQSRFPTCPQITELSFIAHSAVMWATQAHFYHALTHIFVSVAGPFLTPYAMFWFWKHIVCSFPINSSLCIHCLC